MNTVPLGTFALRCPGCGQTDQLSQPDNPEDKTLIRCACGHTITFGALKQANADEMQRFAADAIRRALGKSMK